MVQYDEILQAPSMNFAEPAGHLGENFISYLNQQQEANINLNYEENQRLVGSFLPTNGLNNYNYFSDNENSLGGRN
jgi:hypothetical protein